VVSLGVFGSGFFNLGGVFSNFSVNFGHEGFKRFDFVGFEAFRDFRELKGEIFRGVFFEGGHVVIDMATEDSVSVDLGVIGGSFGVFSESGEFFGGVGDIKTSVTGSFKSSENSVSDSGVGKTDIEDGFEGSSFVDVFFNGVVFSIDGLLSRVQFFELGLGQDSSGKEKSSGISSRVIGEGAGESKSLEFSGVSLAHNFVSGELRVHNLADNFGTSNSNNKSVFFGVIFIFFLGHESFSGIVVSFSFSSSSEFGLESLEVSIIFI
jgi:hypothetical protein